MDRGIPMQSRICFYRKQYFDDQHHSQHLAKMQSRVNDQEPDTQKLAFIRDTAHVYNKYDGLRFTEIDRENGHLADKMVEIGLQQQNKRFVEYPNHYSQKQNQFFVQSQRSLHKCAREKEQLRIALDNQKLLNRIKRKKSAYDLGRWNKDRLKQESYIKNICLHEPKTMIQQSQNKALWTQSQQTQQQFKSKQSQTDLYTFKQSMDAKAARNKKQEQPCQIVLFKKSLALQNELFILKIYISKGLFHMNLSSAKTPQKHHLTISEKEGLQMLQQHFDNDIERFVSLIEYNEVEGAYEISGTQLKFALQEVPQESVSSKQQSQQQLAQPLSGESKKVTQQETEVRHSEHNEESLPKKSEQDTVSKPKQSEQDTFSKGKQTEQDTLSKGKQTEQDTLSKGKQTEQDTFSKGKQTEQDTFSKGKQTEQDTFSKGKQTEQDTFSKGKQSEQDTFSKGKQSEQDTVSKPKQSEQEESKSKRTEESKYKQSEQEESKYKASEQNELSMVKRSEQEESRRMFSEGKVSKHSESKQKSKNPTEREEEIEDETEMKMQMQSESNQKS